MENLSIGQAVLASFPFSDLSRKKLRPCLIVGIAEFEDIVVCQITSQPYDSKRAILLSNDDFKHGLIARDSFIRPDKLATLDQSTIKQILGSVTDGKIHEVKQKSKEFLEIA